MLPLNLAVVVVVAAAVGVGGVMLVRLQEHFAERLAEGVPVSAAGSLVGHGSGAATAAAGWVAALFFAMALLRLQRGPLEPPASTRPVESQSVRQIRHGLRREYTVIRVALVVLLLIAALDFARALAMTVVVERGDGLLRPSLTPTAVEAAGLLAAALLLSWWAGSFARRLERLGAL